MSTIRSSTVKPFMSTPVGRSIRSAIQPDMDSGNIFPSKDNTFRALDMPAENVRLIILGMEPYRDGSADGLAFSSFKPWGEMHPYTETMLLCIKRQLYDYMGEATFKGAFPTGNLLNWQEKGALLLHCALSSSTSKAGAHISVGWGELIKKILVDVLSQEHPIAVVLIGKTANNLYKEAITKVINHNVWQLPSKAEELANDVDTFCNIHDYLRLSYQNNRFWKYEHKDYTDCASVDVEKLIASVRKDISEAQVPLPGSKESLKQLRVEALDHLKELDFSLRADMNYVFDFRTKL